MPDIDIDFDAEKRDDVIKYVIEKYGKEKVSGSHSYSALIVVSFHPVISDRMGIGMLMMAPPFFHVSENGTSKLSFMGNEAEL